MAFEGDGNNGGGIVSPGGFEFGMVGWQYAQPIPHSITFYTDGSCQVSDQYGRPIRYASMPDGRTHRLADSPPDASKDGEVVPRPQFASHAEVIDALAAHHIDWTTYTVRYRQSGSNRVLDRLTKDKAEEFAAKVAKSGATHISVGRSISCAGWPQLPYEELVKLPELPPTPAEELLKIRDPELRSAAFRALGMQVDESAVRPQRNSLPPGVNWIPT